MSVRRYGDWSRKPLGAKPALACLGHMRHRRKPSVTGSCPVDRHVIPIDT